MNSQMNIKSAKLIIPLTTKLCGVYEWLWHLCKTKHIKSLVIQVLLSALLVFPVFVSHPNLFSFKEMKSIDDNQNFSDRNFLSHHFVLFPCFKGFYLCMNSPVDQDLLQLVQQNVESLKDAVKNMSEESENERKKVGDELQRCWTALEDIKQRVELFENRVSRVEGTVSELRGIYLMS